VGASHGATVTVKKPKPCRNWDFTNVVLAVTVTVILVSIFKDALLSYLAM
jgi:hypothetical protein